MTGLQTNRRATTKIRRWQTLEMHDNKEQNTQGKVKQLVAGREVTFLVRVPAVEVKQPDATTYKAAEELS